MCISVRKLSNSLTFIAAVVVNRSIDFLKINDDYEQEEEEVVAIKIDHFISILISNLNLFFYYHENKSLFLMCLYARDFWIEWNTQ